MCRSLLSNHLGDNKKAGNCTIIAFICHVNVSVLFIFLMVSWLGLQFMIVGFAY